MKNQVPFLIGLLVWLLFALRLIPFSPLELSYVQILTLAAPLWLIPLSWQTVAVPIWTKRWALVSAISLSISFVFPIGITAAIFALPWLLLCSLLATEQIYYFVLNKKSGIHKWCILMAFIYLPIGAFHALFDRLGVQPFGYSSTIILLTATHFHYAGYILPLITSLLLQQFNNKLLSIIGWGVILGIPLVALGILATQFQLSMVFETIAVSIMTIAGIGVGILHLILGIQERSNTYAKWWIIAGLALIGGMSLAFCYGWRAYYPIPALTIPFMYALHGTLNAIGFAVPAIIGWKIFIKENLDLN